MDNGEIVAFGDISGTGLTDTSSIDGTHRHYELHLYNIQASANPSFLRLNVNYSGVEQTANYDGAYFGGVTSTTDGVFNGNADVDVTRTGGTQRLNNTANKPLLSKIRFYDPYDSGKAAHIEIETTYLDNNGDIRSHLEFSTHDSDGQMDGFTVEVNTGTITGKYVLLGFD